ncbi:MAG: 3-hydroxyacyl-CoA dehydrogenase NAD-binding domain-containing protein, partial [Acidovorax sp.]|nr:3-hydroxyacyl-CoA dehydrogenase NAD-binding domain-containing protein [Acidovorax sp.]
MQTVFTSIGIVGTGAMGRGIAQIAAQAGSTVYLYDTHGGAADAARTHIHQQWQRLVDKGRLDESLLPGLVQRLVPVTSLHDFAACELVVEAIVERLDAKQELLKQLEAIVSPEAVLASNTSSLSITAVAAPLQRPQRMAGFHFFNPVPLMKVVEVVAGLRTDPHVCTRLAGYARA